ncbi:MAG: bifunctional riboflavin kinase/FAD synthetase [Planctomycetia bacterium]|nr:bifunctional riboflavin kinase/FAD synthetase [Planctomycetia bacterium]
MLVWEKLEPLPEKYWNGAVSVGNFDGVHRGHAAILEKITHRGVPSVVFTFQPHPVRILAPEKAPRQLTWPLRKVELLERLGVDAVVFCPTSPAFLRQNAETFFQKILRDLLHAKIVVEGENFHFGKNREGTPRRMQAWCQTHGMEFQIVESVWLDGAIVSSTRVRQLISEGHIQEANRLLTQPYRTCGTVAHGEARGRTFGFPTANLEKVPTLLPAQGIYACRALVDGQIFPAAVHVGPNVTFHENETKVEAYLLDFSGDLYGKTLTLEWLAKLRETVAFSSAEMLAKQIRKDIQDVRQVISAG